VHACVLAFSVPSCQSLIKCYVKVVTFGNCDVSDRKPTCGVITNPPIRGQNVTLSCTMAYRRLTDENRQNPGAWSSASISWESAAGTFLSNTSTALTSSTGHNVGETLTVDVLTLASGTEIPSYNCTTEFQFADRRSGTYFYAFNNVSWTCISAPVNIWCTYLSHYFKLLLDLFA